jgi:hypothetical protein
MRKIAAFVVSVVAAAGIVSSAAGPASAATPPDKPVVTVGALDVWSSGAVTPDSWRTYVTVPVGGYNFTPGGYVYVTFQDLTSGTSALSGEWTVAGTGPCGPECNNAGKISYTRTLNYPYGTVCGHVLRTWAWDQVKSPQAGYGWSYRDTTIAC